MIHHPAHAS